MIPSTPQKLLRRLAPRVLRVQVRHEHKEPGLASFNGNLVVSAQTFIDAYDAVMAFVPTQAVEHTQGKHAVAAVVRKIRIWAPQVARDVSSINVSDYGDNPAVPDDVIRDAKSLISHALTSGPDGGPLPYSDALVADLEAALDSARVEWAGAELATDQGKALRDAAREAAFAFERDLVAYRRALLVAIGRGHPDYQKLRVAQARVVDSEDDPNAPSAEEADREPDPSEDSQTRPIVLSPEQEAAE